MVKPVVRENGRHYLDQTTTEFFLGHLRFDPFLRKCRLDGIWHMGELAQEDEGIFDRTETADGIKRGVMGVMRSVGLRFGMDVGDWRPPDVKLPGAPYAPLGYRTVFPPQP